MEYISIDELHNRIRNLEPDDLILDVRTPGEFQAGHIQGAQNTPHGEVPRIADNLKQYKTVYVHCKMGGRAKMAAQALQGIGLDNIVCVGDGGMERWMEMGWALEK
ncbi:MAG: rhodanese-like domain-containing protein [Nitrospinota bacterium]|jgi:rhodanese-related sulfurtransferase|nr:rhodanese-like domain-containing protein [Nitrospinota bacterium]|tara:strand:- start:80 stop:397 length:318 start_codon:yes stop_codon:yes gene_type:complete